MKKTSLTIFTLIAVSVFTLAFSAMQVQQWRVDKSHSAINFSVKHFFTPVHGTFNDYEAAITFDPENLQESHIDVTISVNSVDTKNQRRDNHLKTDDFFGAETWPDITFKSSRIEKTGEGEFVAYGQLTLKEVTKEIELPFTLLGIMDHPRREGTKIAGITATTTINRTDYEVGTGDWASNAVVGDMVTVEILLELNSMN